jgi:hypothetical protein
MKLYMISYSTNEGLGSFAIKAKNGQNSWLYEDMAEKVLKEIFDEEVLVNKERIFDAQCYLTNARIEYDDDSWAEYRVIQITAPVLDYVHVQHREEGLE